MKIGCQRANIVSVLTDNVEALAQTTLDIKDILNSATLNDPAKYGFKADLIKRNKLSYSKTRTTTTKVKR